MGVGKAVEKREGRAESHSLGLDKASFLPRQTLLLPAAGSAVIESDQTPLLQIETD